MHHMHYNAVEASVCVCVCACMTTCTQIEHKFSHEL